MSAKKTIKITLFIITLLLWGKGLVCAQNNPYLMSDKLYPRYQRAYKLRKTKEGVAIADSVIREAIAMGDRHGEITAMIVPFLYEYYQADNIKNVEIKAEQLKAKAEKYGMWKYYYFANSNYLNYLIRDRRFIEAVVFINRQSSFAEEHHHPTGVRDAFYMLGNVQQYRGEYHAAVEQYKNYINYSHEHMPETNLTDAYLNICDCLRKTNHFLPLLEEVEQGMKEAVNKNDVFDLMVQQCYAHLMLLNREKFLEDYHFLETHQDDNRGLRDIVVRAINVGKDMFDGKPETDIMAQIDQINKESEYESARLLIAYYNYVGNYQKMIEHQWDLIENYTGATYGQLYDDEDNVAMLTKESQKTKELQSIDYANTQLALNNTQLTLKNSSLELMRSRDAARLAQAQAARNQLDYQNQQIEAAKLRKSLEQQNKLQEIDNEKARAERKGLLYMTLIIVAILMASIGYLIIRRKQSKQLRQNINQLHESIGKLNIAKLKAQDSEMMKTRFVQNMSHEIRTPLNAIVGFSNVLVSMGEELSDDERNELTRYISTNSDLLTTLVNDIIDLSTLQSGSFVMAHEMVAVNDLCRETIETVRHRVPSGVALRFKTSLPDDFTAATDQKRVQQVLINLLTNAEKNTTRGSISLTVKHSNEPDMIIFHVTDTGIGVPQDKMDEIFYRFRKLDNNKQGSGLGLDICRTIAQKLKGEINIDRNYTEGARFYFKIPYRL